jgi:hypothetical protein
MSIILKKLPVPRILLRPNFRNVEVYESKDGLHIISSLDNIPKWGWLKHLSISRVDRYPSWDEMLLIKEKLFGDIDAMMVMPQAKDYVNLHPNTFHIWQTPERWNIH